MEWLCNDAKIWGNESPKARVKAWVRSWADSTKEGEVAALAEATKDSVVGGGGSTEDGTEVSGPDDSNMAAALLFVERPENRDIRTKAIKYQKIQTQNNGAYAHEMKTCLDDELPRKTTLEVHAKSTRQNASIEEHMEFWRMRIWPHRWLLDNADALCC